PENPRECSRCGTHPGIAAVSGPGPVQLLRQDEQFPPGKPQEAASGRTPGATGVFSRSTPKAQRPPSPQDDHSNRKMFFLTMCFANIPVERGARPEEIKHAVKCPKCGFESVRELSRCAKCGCRLASPPRGDPESPLDEPSERIDRYRRRRSRGYDPGASLELDFRTAPGDPNDRLIELSGVGGEKEIGPAGAGLDDWSLGPLPARSTESGPLDVLEDGTWIASSVPDFDETPAVSAATLGRRFWAAVADALVLLGGTGVFA